MNEENKLTERVGRENPFRVPDGYFDALPQQVMSRIPRRRRQRVVLRWAIAAILTGCVCTAGFLLMQHQTAAPQYADTEEVQYGDEELDYTMMDNNDITDYLSEAE